MEERDNINNKLFIAQRAALATILIGTLYYLYKRFTRARPWHEEILKKLQEKASKNFGDYLKSFLLSCLILI